MSTHPQPIVLRRSETGVIRSPIGADRRSFRLSAPILTIPALLLVALFFVIPLVDVLIRSLTDPEVGFQNFVWVFTTETNLTVIWRTFATAFVVTLVCLVLAYPYAYLMTIVGQRTRNLLTLFIMLPLWTSVLVRTVAWMVLLQDTGPINALLQAAGLEAIPLIRTPLGVGIGMAQVLLPFFVLPLYSSLARIDRRLLTAAQTMGARPALAFFTVYLPLSRPGIFAGGATVFILGLGFYIIPALLGSPKETMLPTLIYQQVSIFLNWGHGTALAIVLIVATSALIVLLNRSRRRRKPLLQTDAS